MLKLSFSSRLRSHQRRARAGAAFVELLLGIAVLALGGLAAARALHDGQSVLADHTAAGIRAFGAAPALTREALTSEALTSEAPPPSAAAPDPPAPSLLDLALAPARAQVDQIGHGMQWLKDRIDDGENANASVYAQRAQQADGVPVLGPLNHAASWVQTQQAQFEGGVAKGAVDLLGGLAKTAADPVDSARGIETLAEHLPTPGGVNGLKVGHGLLDVATGNASLDDELARTLDPRVSSAEDAQYLEHALAAPYRDSWNQGKYSEVAGHVTFDLAALIASDGLGEGAEGAELTEEAATVESAAQEGGLAHAEPPPSAASARVPPSVDDLSEAGKAMDPADKAGRLTKAGRALQKHRAGGRASSGKFPEVSGNQEAINAAGQAQLDDILTDPGSTTTPLGRGGWQVTAPDGRAVRFNADGTLSGFID